MRQKKTKKRGEIVEKTAKTTPKTLTTEIQNKPILNNNNKIEEQDKGKQRKKKEQTRKWVKQHPNIKNK